MARGYLLLAVIATGNSADVSTCVVGPDGLQQCREEPRVDDSIILLQRRSEEASLEVDRGGAVEQEGNDWWLWSPSPPPPPEAFSADVGAEQKGKWAVISETSACESNGDGKAGIGLDTIQSFGKDTEVSLDQCYSSCQGTPNCVAVDWFKEGGICNFFSSACTIPTKTGKGASSYVLTPTEMKKKACSSWKEDVQFMGKDWTSTDLMSTGQLADAIKGVFGECGSGAKIEVHYVEKDVGLSLSANSMTKAVLQWANSDMKLMHTGVRFLGCGKNVIFQLQNRAWGLGNEGTVGKDAFAASFGYPLTSPDNREVWHELVCDVGGKGKRDVGGGNIIFWKSSHEDDLQKWVNEKKIAVFDAAHVGEFFDGIAPYFGWWNVQSKYNVASIARTKPDGSGQELLRGSITCDSFANWLVAQAGAFAAQKHPGDFLWGDTHLKMNVVSLLVHDHADGGAAAPPPVVANYSGLAKRAFPAGQSPQSAQTWLDLALRRQMHTENKDKAVAQWQQSKGMGECKEEPEWDRAVALSRDWPKEGSWSWSTGGVGRCADRIGVVVPPNPFYQGYDIVKMSAWRFTHLSGGDYLAATEWDTEVVSTYSDNLIYDDMKGQAGGGKFQLPPGTPRHPFAEQSLPNPCGPRCQWQDPVPPAPAGGYVLAE